MSKNQLNALLAAMVVALAWLVFIAVSISVQPMTGSTGQSGYVTTYKHVSLPIQGNSPLIQGN
jgi:hypothetical protein